MWSLDYEKCTKCGTTERPHKARGLCDLCYQKTIEVAHKITKSNRGEAAEMLTEDNLRRMYFDEGKSFSDIAQIAGCSRQYVNKKMREYGIETRNLKESRKLALQKEKISVNGTTYQHTYYDYSFFKRWSKEMAYVLGVIYTDGCLHPGRDYGNLNTTSTSARVGIAQKDEQFLINLGMLMKTNSRIFKKENNGDNYIYHIDIVSNEIYDDLIRLGLTPKKSLTIKYPDIPEEYESHFIRGLWDGDGCVTKSGLSRNVAKIVSGSEEFITKLKERLLYHGIKTGKISLTRAYSLSISAESYNDFRTFLYKDVDKETMYLKRKWEKFFSVS